MADSNQDPPFGAAFTNGWPQSATDMAAAVERAWRGLLPGGGAEPTADDATRSKRRERFLEARRRAERTIPDLSGVEF